MHICSSQERITTLYRESKKHLRFVLILEDPLRLFVEDVATIDAHGESNEKAREADAVSRLGGIARKQIRAVEEDMECGGRGALSFQEISQVSEWIRKCGERFPSLRMGLYATLLEHWFEHFSPEQFVLISSDDFLANPAWVLRTTADFLAIPAQPGMGGRPQAARTQGRPLTPLLPEEVIGEVKELFRPHVVRLQKLLASQASAPSMVGSFGWLKRG